MRQPKYNEMTPEKLLVIEGLAREGAKVYEICKVLGVSRNTFHKWRKENPDIDKAIERGKMVADYKVENALLKNALGYEYTESMIDAKGNKKLTKKKAPPNVIAQIFWLKNRRPDKWKDQVENEITGAVPVILKDDVKE